MSAGDEFAHGLPEQSVAERYFNKAAAMGGQIHYHSQVRYTGSLMFSPQAHALLLLLSSPGHKGAREACSDLEGASLPILCSGPKGLIKSVTDPFCRRFVNKSSPELRNRCTYVGLLSFPNPEDVALNDWLGLYCAHSLTELGVNSTILQTQQSVYYVASLNII